MSNWQTKTIRSIATLIKDGTHGTHKEQEGGIPLLSAKDIVNGRVVANNSPRLISSSDFNLIHKNYKLQNSDILLTIVGSLGRVAVVRNYNDNYTFQRSVAILRFNEEIEPRYMYYLMTEWRFQKELLKRESKGAQGGVYLGEIAKIKVDLPEKPEQERILAVLEVWDEYIEKLEQKIALKEQLKKGLMQQLLTGRLRLPGYSADWRSVKLGDIAKMQSGGTPPSKNHNYYDGDVIWVSISDMTSSKKYISSSSKNLSQEGLANSAAKYYPAGTVLYAMYASIGECVIAGVPVTSSQAILGIQPSAVLDNEFLYYYLTDMKEKIKLLGQQGAQANLNAGIVKNFKLTLPGIKEQRSIALILSDVDDELTLLRQGKKHILKQKKYLLKNLITGAISTPENLKRIGVQ